MELLLKAKPLKYLKLINLNFRLDLLEELPRKDVLLEACNFTKISNPPWVFFTFFKLYKWYQIAQRITDYKNF